MKMYGQRSERREREREIDREGVVIGSIGV